ncbi:MAG: hypothetical protein GX591_01755 [Planctomycetes bacterium]|nr:hypothetical protein [Planctomycetota bacterium]
MIASREPTADRVMDHTPAEINDTIELLTRARIADIADRMDAIEQRLHRIDHEWDIERALESNAAIITLLCLTVGRRRRLLRYLPIAVAGFLLQHAVQGWCPPVSVFRRLGVRTMREIDRERYALKALRGDFDDIDKDADPCTRTNAAVNAADCSRG